MFSVAPIEYVGYLASVFIVISLMMTSIVQLRVINSIGCILFVIYGFNIKAYPVGVINLFIFFVNIYYIIKMKKDNKK